MEQSNDSSLSTRASAIIERAVAWHGGWDRWRRLRQLDARLEALGGPIPWSKGIGRRWPPFGLVEVDPRGQRVVFRDWPEPGVDTTYVEGRVDLGPERDAAARRRATRSRGMLWPWSSVDAAYFFGAALCTYYGVPFILPDAEVLSCVERGLGDQRRAVLTVRFPAVFHTHGPVQRFWFRADGALVRHDYHAEVLGPIAWGAHLSRDYVEIDGWPIARRRDVFLGAGWFPRIARSPIPVLNARLTPLAVHVDG